jgi:hypothetical protein
MQSIRRGALGALAVLLLAVPAAAAQHIKPAHVVGGAPAAELLGQTFADFYASGLGDPAHACERFGPRDRVLAIGATGGEVTCTIKPGTPVFIGGFGAACSDVEPAPFFGADAPAQRACAMAWVEEHVVSFTATVNGGAPIVLSAPAYLVTSPQVRVTVPEDSAVGLPPGPATLVAHAYAAVLRGLRPGIHTITFDVVITDGPYPSTTVTLEVVPPGRRR